jgi:hypothetical protein
MYLYLFFFSFFSGGFSFYFFQTKVASLSGLAAPHPLAVEGIPSG